MQPYLSIIVRDASLIYINGRLVGESDGESGLMLPVMPRGAVYVEVRPFRPGALHQARKIVFSGGHPIPDSVGDGAFAVEWPGGVTEFEILSEEGDDGVDDAPFVIETAEDAALACLSAYFEGDLPSAEMFLTPAYARTHPLDGLFSEQTGACRLKYGRVVQSAVGVLQILSPRMARVVPVKVAGEFTGGMWRVANFSPMNLPLAP